MVRGQKAAGYDFVKVHENLGPVTYEAIVTKARQVCSLLQLPQMRYVSAGTRNSFAQQRQGLLNFFAGNSVGLQDRAACF